MIPCVISECSPVNKYFMLKFKATSCKYFSHRQSIFPTPALIGNQAIVLTRWNSRRQKTEWAGLLVSMEFYAREVEPHA